MTPANQPEMARGPAALAVSIVMFASQALGATVLQDVRLIDGTGNPPQAHVDLLMEGKRISAIAPHDRLAAPADAVKIDGSGLSVLPGLISDHSHLGQVDGTKAGSDNMTRANILRQLSQYEAYGVTTVMSLGLNMEVFYELQPAVHAGSLPGADMFGADRGFGAVHGGPPAEMGISDAQVYRPDSPAAARAAVRETIARHPTLVKLWLDDFNGTKPDKIPAEIYTAIIDEAHRHHVRVAAHIFYLEDAKSLVRAGVDVLAHGIRDRPVDPEMIHMLLAREVWYIPTLSLDESFYLFAEQPQMLEDPTVRHALQPALAAQLSDPSWRQKALADAHKLEVEKQARDMNLRNLKTLYDAGVKIGFGTDSGATPLRVAGFAEHRELRLLVEAGLTPLQAITLATRNAAQLLKLEDRGVLVAGKLADLVVVRGNPARDIGDLGHISEVWRGGQRSAHIIEDFTP